MAGAVVRLYTIALGSNARQLGGMHSAGASRQLGWSSCHWLHWLHCCSVGFWQRTPSCCLFPCNNVHIQLCWFLAAYGKTFPHQLVVSFFLSFFPLFEYVILTGVPAFSKAACWLLGRMHSQHHLVDLKECDYDVVWWHIWPQKNALRVLSKRWDNKGGRLAVQLSKLGLAPFLWLVIISLLLLFITLVVACKYFRFLHILVALWTSYDHHLLFFCSLCFLWLVCRFWVPKKRT